MAAWTLHFGPSLAGFAWVVQREDGTGPAFVCPPESYEEACGSLVRHARADEVDAVHLMIDVDGGAPRVVRQVLDR